MDTGASTATPAPPRATTTSPSPGSPSMRSTARMLRRGTEFHTHFTWPDGTPVEVVNDRNRRWGVDPWGHFGFSRFPDGRRYVEFLTAFFQDGQGGLEMLGRIAQNALYFHEGPAVPRFPGSAAVLLSHAGARGHPQAGALDH